mgnify:CR=1 FL=1
MPGSQKHLYNKSIASSLPFPKNICSLVFKEKLKAIDINGRRYELEDVSINSITKLKKELTESALSNLV